MILDQRPVMHEGHAVWAAASGGARVRFVGRGPADSRAAALAVAVAAEPVVSSPPRLAWARQVHSAAVLAADDGAAGDRGEGDALVTDSCDLGLVVVTADCVPLLLAAPGAIAAVHAGWRGIVGGVVANALAALVATPAAAGGDGEIEAWIGPAIGACCYEVGDEVAAPIAHVSPAAVVARGRGEKPHVDLQAAVAAQLRQGGVTRIHVVATCTRCAAGALWSYRRDGAGAGRNFAFIWRDSEA